MAIREANQPPAGLEKAGELGLVHPEAGRTGVEQRRLESLCVARPITERAGGSRQVRPPVVDIEVEEPDDRSAPGLVGKQLGE